MKTKISFTKKDLFVVLGCVVFLLGNLAVTSSNGRARAKEIVCRANLQKWGAVFDMYTSDNNGSFQEGWTVNIRCGDRWFDLLRPYLDDNNDLHCCPTAVELRELYGTATGVTGKFSAWGKFIGGPVGEKSLGYPTSLRGSYGSYGINIYVCNPTAAVGRAWALFWRTPNVSGADQIPVLFDSMWIDIFALPDDEPPMFDGDFSENGHIDGMKNVCIDRHNAAVNMLFMDFSVRKVGLKQLWTLPWHREWSEDLAAAGGLPTEWNDPNHWMYNMKDYPLE
jgi:prepilin-type processing-associated H-X9-DG protein